jgi:uncharacterized protein YjiS (DUF1127 family)
MCGMTMTQILTTFTEWARRARTRRHLRALEAFRLADIGLCDADRRRECAKWFWRK